MTFPAQQAPLPNFLIVGAMKCGTSTLARNLEQHPEVFIPHRKELGYFLQPDSPLETYQREFSEAGSARAVGEATPHYMFHADALRRIQTLIPDIRIVVALRDPVARAYSHYWHDRSRGRRPPPFASVVADGLAEVDPLARVGQDPGYISRGYYVAQLRNIETLFGREAIHVLILDDWRTNPVHAYARLCQFLGVDVAIEPAHAPRNEYVRFRSTRFRSLYRRWPRRVAKAAGRLNQVRERYPELDPDLRLQLRCHYADTIAALEQWLGRSLPWASSAPE